MINLLIFEVIVHLVMELAVDNIPVLRNACRGNTMRTVEESIRNTTMMAIKEGIEG